MAGHYIPLLVLLSLAISILASWVALDLSARVCLQTHQGRRTIWIAVGSVAMGFGIWSMHYVGMVAFAMPVPVLYDWPTVLLSFVAALTASAIAFTLVTRERLSRSSTVAGSLAMGCAISSMHYIGMAAMRMPMAMRYSWPWVALSALAAVVISLVGLRLTFGSRLVGRGWSSQKLFSALLMGTAIPTMHYLGMAAARPAAGPGRFSSADLHHAFFIGVPTAVGFGIVCLLLLSATVLLAGIDRHVAGFESALHGTRRSHLQLQQHLERLQGAFRAGGFGIWECDPATNLFYVDNSLRDLFDLPHDGKPVPNAEWRAIVHPEDASALDQHWNRCFASGDRYENEYRLLTSKGNTRRVRSVASIIRDPQGTLQRVLGMTWDVTAERQREQEILDQATRFRFTLEAIGDAVLATDEQSRVVFLNPAAARLTAWPADEAVGRHYRDVFVTLDEVTGTLNPDPVQRCLDCGGSFSKEDGLLQSREGRRYRIRKHVALTGQGHAAVITFQDITSAHRLEQDLLYAATHDSLTGLANRAAFEKALTSLWDGSRYSGGDHSLCIVDLDRFKMINDASGHPAGDALLRQIAQLLRQQLRPTDLVARIGGDEFMVLMPDTPVHVAQPLLEELLAAIAQLHFHWHGKVYDLTASLGLVCFDCFSPSPETLLSQADAAVFTAKRNGRNQLAVYVDEGRAADHLLEMQIASDLRRCIEENCFELHAQPIVPVQNNSPARYFEVLLRMRGKDGQLVSPNLFIPAAERYGMMAMVDRWVIRNTFLQYAHLSATCPAARLAINLSAQALSDPSLWSYVSDQFAATRVSPASITFELTETGIIDNLAAAKTFIQSCRAAGSHIALDDFGTGLSSLSYLKEFSLDVIKIDGGFVRTLIDSRLDQAILRSICEIARSVGATTVAECVEDDRTLDMLRSLNVDWVQGWATGRPVPFVQALTATQAPLPSSASAPDLRPVPQLVAQSV